MTLNEDDDTYQTFSITLKVGTDVDLAGVPGGNAVADAAEKAKRAVCDHMAFVADCRRTRRHPKVFDVSGLEVQDVSEHVYGSGRDLRKQE